MPSPASGIEPPDDDRPGQGDGADAKVKARLPFAITRSEIEAARGPKLAVDPERPIAVFEEIEAVAPRASEAHVAKHVAESRVAERNVAEPRVTEPQHAEVVSLILAGAECALRCTMCDLWRQTLDHATPVGAIPRQIAWGLSQIARLSGPVGDAALRWVKLYNASNFFDQRSVPREDWEDIATLVRPFGRVIVENHPRFVGDRVFDFAARLDGKLEVAIGLESADDAILEILQKRMTCRDFESAASRLRQQGVDVRAFVMLGPPGCPAGRRLPLLRQTLRFAAECGVRHVSVIPTRGGNGMMERLRDAGWFVPPGAGDLEAAMRESFGLGLPMVITADLWDWGNLQGHCEACRELRLGRLRRVNLRQQWFEIDAADHDRIVESGREGCECRRG